MPLKKTIKIKVFLELNFQAGMTQLKAPPSFNMTKIN